MRLEIPRSLPRRVFLACMGLTALGIAVALAFTVTVGWLPPRESAGVVLPLYFALLLIVLSVSSVVSGDTLMHHHRTGTIQRASSPVEFWCVNAVQIALAAVLLVAGCLRWQALYG